MGEFFSTKILIKLCLFYGSFLVFPYLAWLIWRLYKGTRSIARFAFLGICLLFVWSRFIEPQIISVKEYCIESVGIKADIALISDLHIGIYKSTDFAQRVVNTLNTLSVDFVVLAGDIIYEADESVINELAKILGRINKPVFAVLGNHDYQLHYPVENVLRSALEKNNIQIIEQAIIKQNGYQLVGLGDHWNGDDSDIFLRRADSRLPTLILSHNPDSAMQLDPAKVNLVLSGHTHGGQIRLPWLYKKAIPSTYGFDQGLEERVIGGRNLKIFVSSGLGEIGLPMRLFIPPSIDVLNLSP